MPTDRSLWCPSNGQKLANALARKLLLLLGKSVVTVSETQKRCRVGFGGCLPRRHKGAFDVGQRERHFLTRRSFTTKRAPMSCASVI